MKAPRATCSVCRLRYRTRPDGSMWVHGPADNPCKGSSRPPADEEPVYTATFESADGPVTVEMPGSLGRIHAASVAENEAEHAAAAFFVPGITYRYKGTRLAFLCEALGIHPEHDEPVAFGFERQLDRDGYARTWRVQALGPHAWSCDFWQPYEEGEVS